MNYITVYNSLIERFLLTQASGYVEKHHIVPRCMGGSDHPSNLVKLPAREHFIAHLLLAKIYGGKAANAAWMMSNMKRYSSRNYAWLKESAIAHQSEQQSGSGNHFFGRRHSLESRKKMSETHKGENHNLYGKKQSEFTRLKCSESLRGRTKSKEHRLNISLAMKGKPSPKKGIPRDPEVIQKMVATRQLRGNYEAWNKGKHKEAA